MHALIRQGNGKYYVSAVFGCYKYGRSDNDQCSSKSSHSPYYVIFDPEKTKLIKCPAMQPNTPYLIPQLLIVEADHTDWILDNNGFGGESFLPRKTADKIIADEKVPEDILEQCLATDRSYTYNEYTEVLTEKDIRNLDCASGGFHDAFIAKQKESEDGTLYLLFEGTWGCSIEIWFWDDLEYSTESRNPDLWDPYWFSSTIIQQGGFIYLVDEENMTVDQIDENYCWFKARHMKYHIIPD